MLRYVLEEKSMNQQTAERTYSYAFVIDGTNKPNGRVSEWVSAAPKAVAG